MLDDEDQAIVERVLSYYLDQTEPDDVDTEVLADNVIAALNQRRSVESDNVIAALKQRRGVE